MSLKSGRIPVYAGEHLIEFCDEVRAWRLSRASNVTLVMARRGQVTRVNIAGLPVDAEGGGEPSDTLHLTYEEHLGGHAVPMLRRVVGGVQFVKWSDRDSFNPRRFNPDLLPRARR